MENKTLVERLREYVDANENSTPDFFEIFGVDYYKDCRHFLKCAKSMADAIEAEHLPRPRFEDGSIVRRGDKFLYNGKPFDVKRIRVDDDGEFYFKVDGRVTNWFDKTQRMKRPEPEVLDADGIPIKIGDTVFSMDGKQYEVDSIDRYVDGSFKVNAYGSDGWPRYGNPEDFAHKPPDTQARLNEDAVKGSNDYWGCCFECGDDDKDCPALKDGQTPKERYKVRSCFEARNLDILHRQRELDRNNNA